MSAATKTVTTLLVLFLSATRARPCSSADCELLARTAHEELAARIAARSHDAMALFAGTPSDALNRCGLRRADGGETWLEITDTSVAEEFRDAFGVVLARFELGPGWYRETFRTGDELLFEAGASVRVRARLAVTDPPTEFVFDVGPTGDVSYVKSMGRLGSGFASKYPETIDAAARFGSVAAAAIPALFFDPVAGPQARIALRCAESSVLATLESVRRASRALLDTGAVRLAQSVREALGRDRGPLGQVTRIRAAVGALSAMARTTLAVAGPATGPDSEAPAPCEAARLQLRFGGPPEQSAHAGTSSCGEGFVAAGSFGTVAGPERECVACAEAIDDVCQGLANLVFALRSAAARHPEWLDEEHGPEEDDPSLAELSAPALWFAESALIYGDLFDPQASCSPETLQATCREFVQDATASSPCPACDALLEREKFDWVDLLNVFR